MKDGTRDIFEVSDIDTTECWLEVPPDLGLPTYTGSDQSIIDSLARAKEDSERRNNIYKELIRKYYDKE
jgi:hypothetical protein